MPLHKKRELTLNNSSPTTPSLPLQRPNSPAAVTPSKSKFSNFFLPNPEKSDHSKANGRTRESSSGSASPTKTFVNPPTPGPNDNFALPAVGGVVERREEVVMVRREKWTTNGNGSGNANDRTLVNDREVIAAGRSVSKGFRNRLSRVCHFSLPSTPFEELSIKIFNLDQTALENPDGLTNDDAKPPSQAIVPTKGLLSDVFGSLGRVVDDRFVSAIASYIHAYWIFLVYSRLDSELLLERIVRMLSRLPDDSKARQTITGSFIDILWKDLTHPPLDWMGVENRWRTPDGRGNNPLFPMLGAAGTPYARSVPPLHPKPQNLPDAQLVFDALLKRDKFVPQPSGISSFLFAFATFIIHSCFHTTPQNRGINQTSSYLDLSPVYGNNEAEQKRVRIAEGEEGYGLGKLYNDVFAEERFRFAVPAVIVLAVLFSRNHNYIADRIYKINENKTYRDPNTLDEKKRKEQDDEIFNRSRLVNCGFFVNMVLVDYVRTILNLNKTASNWVLDPRTEVKELLGGKGEKAGGNVCSVEFNLLYRWHATLSEKDVVWAEELFRNKFGPDVDFSTLTPQEFWRVSAKDLHDGGEPKTWEFGRLKRGKDGSFDDDVLSQILVEAIDEPAGAFKARGIPEVMRVIELMSIETARKDWNVCTLNEFRKFVNLKPYTSFEEFNRDPEIVKAMAALYTHPDNIELYPGLMAEEPKETGDGAGLCPGYTISRAILADAVALVRGDRFYTTAFNAAELTSWGFEECCTDPKTGSFGGVASKLILRNLPHNFRFNSTYALFPFTTPPTMKRTMEELKLDDRYDFSMPTKAPEWHGINSFEAVMSILNNHQDFGVIYTKNVEAISKRNYGFFIGWDDPKSHGRERMYMDKVVFPPGYEKNIKEHYAHATQTRIEKASFGLSGNKTRVVDVVRDVTNVTNAMWIAHTFGIPVKTDENPLGLFTAQELYRMLAAMFIYVFLNFDAAAGFKIRDAAIKSSKVLGAIVQARILQAKGITTFEAITHIDVKDFFSEHPNFGMHKDTLAFYTRLVKEQPEMTDSMAGMVSNCLSIMTASNVNQGQVAAQTINFYLQDSQKEAFERLQELSKRDDPESDKEVMGYIWEAMRLDPQVAGIPRVCRKTTTVQDGDKTIHIEEGDWILASTSNASLDPNIYPEPEKVIPTRDPKSYRVFGHAMHNCLGSKLVVISMPAMIKSIFKLKNLRRAPGDSGKLIRLENSLVGSRFWMFISHDGTLWPFPTTMKLQYDVE
ncbi:heme peroxidase [Atractiella rhizophila]|nr:heme peroxidase [Atractiella rhizophila]